MQIYRCISKHWRLEIRVSGDAQNECAITTVGTVLNLSDRSVNALHQAISHVSLDDDGIVYYMGTAATLDRILE